MAGDGEELVPPTTEESGGEAKAGGKAQKKPKKKKKPRSPAAATASAPDSDCGGFGGASAEQEFGVFLGDGGQPAIEVARDEGGSAGGLSLAVPSGSGGLAAERKKSTGSSSAKKKSPAKSKKTQKRAKVRQRLASQLTAGLKEIEDEEIALPEAVDDDEDDEAMQKTANLVSPLSPGMAQFIQVEGATPTVSNLPPGTSAFTASPPGAMFLAIPTGHVAIPVDPDPAGYTEVNLSSMYQNAGQPVDDSMAGGFSAGVAPLDSNLQAELPFASRLPSSPSNFGKESTGNLLGTFSNLLSTSSGHLATSTSSFVGFLGNIASKGNQLVSRFLNEDQDDDPPKPSPPLVSAPKNVAGVSVAEHAYNLKRVPYGNPKYYKERSYWHLKSGLPFPSYHGNPSRDFPARWTDIPNAIRPCEDLRAPRIRLSPHELERRAHNIELIKLKALTDPSDPPGVAYLNLSYQDMGDPYQMEQLVAFLDVNRGVRRLALTDNSILSVQQLYLPKLRVLYLSRNQILTFNVIPSFPELEELYLSYNFITSTVGLTNEKFPKLRNLTLTGNPICDVRDYHKLIAKASKTIEVLDTKRLLRVAKRDAYAKKAAHEVEQVVLKESRRLSIVTAN